MNTIMVVEDHAKIRANMMFQLKDQGYKVLGKASAEEALVHMADPTRSNPDLMLLDIRLGAMSGVDLIHKLSADHNLPPTIVVSGEATISETVDALRMGVYDFIEKPVGKERLIRSVINCLEHRALENKVRELQSKLEESDLMLGDAPAMNALKKQIDKVAPTNGRVLINGESGTGKELIASRIHRNSKRIGKPFVKINCAAIPVNLIEDELFGHVRGAFTDARSDKPGLFEAAHTGTLFLDEIGDMDLGLQARLLRVLEDGVVRRIGEHRDRMVDVRVIAATNGDLEKMIDENRFREDLYFRISAIPLTAPPLRERGPDIPMLLSWFIAYFCDKNQIRRKKIDAEVFDIMKRYHWPGNIRELKNLCERLVILGGDPITVEHLPSSVFREQAPFEGGIVPPSVSTKCLPLREFKAQCEKEYIEHILQRTNWNFNQAAKMLQIQRTYLYQKASALHIRKGGTRTPMV